MAKLEVSLKVESISRDILDYFTVTYDYTDFAGKTTSKTLTGPETVSFYVDNPNLGEVESCPFTVALTLNDKGTAAKTEVNYDGTLKYELDVNGYYGDGSLVTDSGKVQGVDSNLPFNDLNNFKNAVSRSGIEKITYKTFFCKTLSGEWHIGAVKAEN